VPVCICTLECDPLLLQCGGLVSQTLQPAGTLLTCCRSDQSKREREKEIESGAGGFRGFSLAVIIVSMSVSVIYCQAGPPVSHLEASEGAAQVVHVLT
jgi:hypothetical protein